MSNYLILTRLMLKNLASTMNPFTRTTSNGTSGRKTLIRSAFLALVLIIALASVVYMEVLLSRGLQAVGQQLLLPGLAVLIAMVGTLVMGLFQALSELYQGKDAPWLAVLPVTSRQVFAARLTALYCSELLLNAVIMLPAFILYLIGVKQVLPGALTALPVLLLSPVLPLAIVSLLASGLMRIGAIARHRESIVMGLSMLLAIGYSVTVTLSSNRSGDDLSTTEMMVNLVQGDGLLGLAVRRFPPAQWAVRAFTGDIPQLLLLLVVSAAAVALVIWLAGGSYLEQALLQGEHTSRRVRATAANWQEGTPFKALVRLEWRELLRTPAWLYNGLAGVVMFPLMICIGFLSGTASAGTDWVVENLQRVVESVDAGYVIVIIAAALSLGSMVNPAVATAISREGGRYPFAMTLPVTQKKRYSAKLAVGVEINLVCTLLIALVATLLLRLSPLYMLAGLALAMLLSFASGCASLAIDAIHPILKWMNEMQAIKNNANSVYGMLLWVAMIGLCVLPCVLLWTYGGWAVLAGCAGMALCEAVAAWLWLMHLAGRNIWLPEEMN